VVFFRNAVPCSLVEISTWLRGATSQKTVISILICENLKSHITDMVLHFNLLYCTYPYFSSLKFAHITIIKWQVSPEIIFLSVLLVTIC
jgi:hypothetical protein